MHTPLSMRGKPRHCTTQHAHYKFKADSKGLPVFISRQRDPCLHGPLAPHRKSRGVLPARAAHSPKTVLEKPCSRGPILSEHQQLTGTCRASSSRPAVARNVGVARRAVRRVHIDGHVREGTSRSGPRGPAARQARNTRNTPSQWASASGSASTPPLTLCASICSHEQVPAPHARDSKPATPRKPSLR